MEIIKNFGIQPILLLAQLVNFTILLIILQKFLYKPMLKVLNERKNKIADSLKNADEIEKRLKSMDAERDKRLNDAIHEAKEIVEEAAQNASDIIRQSQQKAAADVQIMTDRAEKLLELEREKLHKEIREEIGNMVILGIEKVINKTLSTEDRKKLADEAVTGLK